MSFSIVRHIKRSLKTRYCYYCGELMPRGSSYVKMIQTDGADLQCSNLHKECLEAWRQVADEDAEIEFGMMKRGLPVYKDEYL